MPANQMKFENEGSQFNELIVPPSYSSIIPSYNKIPT